VIKKQITFFILLFTFGFSLFAEEKPFVLNGSFEFSLSEENLLDNKYISTEVGPVFGSSLNLNTIFSEPIKNETIELGLSFDVTKAISFTEGMDSDSSYTSSDNNLYTKIQRMIDWYINNRDRYKMSDYPGNYTDNGGWPTTLYGTKTRYQFIIGNSVEDINSVAWTSNKWDDASQLYTEIKDHIKEEIYAISTEVDRADDVDQFTIETLSVADKEMVLKEKEAIESFNSYVFGDSTSAEMGELLNYGYIKIKNVLNIIDIVFEYKGADIEVGKALKSTRTSQGNSLVGMKMDLSLPEDVLPQLTAGVLVALTEGKASEAEDWESITYDLEEGEAGDLGLLLSANYSVKSLGSLGLEVGLVDINNPDNFILALYPTLDIWHKNRLKIEGEFDIFGYSDKEIENDTLKIGMGTSLDIEATFSGFTPRLNILWKNDQFYGEHFSNSEEDRLPGSSWLDDFESSNVKMAGALDFGVIFDTSKLFGRELFSVGGGYNLFAYDPIGDSKLFRYGWYSTMNIKLKDALDIPFTLNLDLSRYNHPDFVEYADYSLTGAEDSILDGVSLDIAMSYKYSDNLDFLANFKGSDLGNRFTNTPIMSLGFSVVSRF